MTSSSSEVTVGQDSNHDELAEPNARQLQVDSPVCATCLIPLRDNRQKPLKCMACGSLTHRKCSSLSKTEIQGALSHFSCAKCLTSVAPVPHHTPGTIAITKQRLNPNLSISTNTDSPPKSERASRPHHTVAQCLQTQNGTPSLERSGQRQVPPGWLAELHGVRATLAVLMNRVDSLMELSVPRDTATGHSEVTKSRTSRDAARRRPLTARAQLPPRVPSPTNLSANAQSLPVRQSPDNREEPLPSGNLSSNGKSKNRSPIAVGSGGHAVPFKAARATRSRRSPCTLPIVFVSGIEHTVTAAQMLDYCVSIAPSVNTVSKFKFKTDRQSYASFAIAVPETDVDLLLSPDAWTKGMIFKIFSGSIDRGRMAETATRNDGPTDILSGTQD